MNAKQRFTLIELLLIIAVIAILIALLLPALSNAREMGKRSVCFANMKNISLMYNAYVGENNGWLPATTRNPDAPENNTQGFTNSAGTWTSYAGRIYMHGLLAGAEAPHDNATVIRNAKIFVCPSREISGWYEEAFPFRTSYLLDGSRQSYMKLAAVKKPTSKMMTMDHSGFGINHYYRGQDAWNNNCDYVPGTADSIDFIFAKVTTKIDDKDFMRGRHMKTVNITYFDGHTQNVPSADVAKQYYVRKGTNSSGDMFDLSN